jgi:hypothetical protein
MTATFVNQRVAHWLIKRLFFGIGKQSVISSLAGTFMHSSVVCSLSEVDIHF